MKQTRFTPTRAVLVIILIGGLYKVGTLVNPPPVGPPATPQELATAAATEASARTTPPALPAMSAQQQKQQMQERMTQQYKQSKYMADKAKLEMKLNHDKPLQKDDGITPVYFQDTPMGTAGFVKTAQQAAHVKQITEEVNRRLPNPTSSKITDGPIPPLPPQQAGAKAASAATAPTAPAGK